MSRAEESMCNSSVNPRKVELLEAIRQSGRILDVGCGSGHYSTILNRRGHSVTLVDPVDRRSDEARSLNFYEVPIESFQIEAKTYSAIIAFDVIEHLEDDKVFLQSAFEGLVPGGRLLLSVPFGGPTPLDALDLAPLHYKDKSHYREYDEDAIRAVVENAGFEILLLSVQINQRAPKFPFALRTGSWLSQLAAWSCYLQVRLFLLAGLFVNLLVSDLFIVARKPH